VKDTRISLRVLSGQDACCNFEREQGELIFQQAFRAGHFALIPRIGASASGAAAETQRLKTGARSTCVCAAC